MNASGSGPVDMLAFVNTTIRGTYRLKRHVGEGNFGAVFEADQYFLGVPVRRVALKVCREAPLDERKARTVFSDALLLADAMDMMDDAEARAHLVHVFDVGVAAEAGHRGFLAMEFVEGTTLEQQFHSYAPSRRIPQPLLMNWMTQTCRAIAALHRLSPPVLHRDLKPDNILLGTDRRVRVVDFGLAAKLMYEGFVPGVAGTLTYMAPETMQERSVPASDVYSVGLIMYEALTGQRPFASLIVPADLPAALHRDWLRTQKKQYRVIRPSTLNATVDQRLEAIVMRCLEFDARKRPANGDELLQALMAAGARTQTVTDAGGNTATKQTLENALRASGLPKDERVHLLLRLSDLLEESGEYLQAAERRQQAWELVKNSAVLRDRSERAALLRRVAEAYAKAGNRYQSTHFDKLARHEEGIA